MQFSQVISPGNLTSFPSNPARRPHGKKPSRSAELSLGRSNLKSWAKGDPSLRAKVQLAEGCAFRTLHWKKFLEPLEAIKWISDLGAEPQGSSFPLLKIEYDLALGSIKCNSCEKHKKVLGSKYKHSKLLGRKNPRVTYRSFGFLCNFLFLNFLGFTGCVHLRIRLKVLVNSFALLLSEFFLRGSLSFLTVRVFSSLYNLVRLGHLIASICPQITTLSN